MSNTVKTPCEKRVTELINHKLTKFTEDDKEWLMTLEESIFEKLFPNEPEVKKEKPAEQFNAEKAIQVLKEQFKKPEDYFKILPDELRDSVRAGLKLHQEQREKMIKGILDNTEDVWNEESLKTMDVETLKKVFASVKVEGDFSLLSIQREATPVVNEEEILVPTGIVIKKEEDK